MAKQHRVEKIEEYGRGVKRKRGFTLSQTLVVIGLFGVMAATGTVGYRGYRRARATARRVECDLHLKEVAAVLRNFQADHRHLPDSLKELVDRSYITPEMLRCPADPYLSEHADDPKYLSYSNGYIIREPLDSGELPIILCPYHQADGVQGTQAFKNGDTTQYRLRSATLAADDISGVLTIERPGKGILELPGRGEPPLELLGGDRLQTGAGAATIRFADGSTATLEENSDLTVLQSYLESQQSTSLYTVVHQALGSVNYYVNPGSSFDVATPTATAGALGTVFNVQVANAAPSFANPHTTETYLTVKEHRVALSVEDRTIEVTDQEPRVKAHDPQNKQKARKPRTKFKKKNK